MSGQVWGDGAQHDEKRADAVKGFDGRRHVLLLQASKVVGKLHQGSHSNIEGPRLSDSGGDVDRMG